MRILPTIAFAVLATTFPTPAWATTPPTPKTVTNTDGGPLVGPSRPWPTVYGTDLGFTVSWGNYQVVLFGDTHASILDNLGSSYDNDAVCFFPTSPTPDVLAPLSFSANAKVTRASDLSGGPGLIMDANKTPAASFSAGPLGYYYGVFVRGQARRARFPMRGRNIGKSSSGSKVTPIFRYGINLLSIA